MHVEDAGRAAVPRRARGVLGRFRRSLAPVTYDEPVPDPGPPADVLEMLRRLGGAMCDGGDAADYIAEHLDAIARAYDTHGVSFFVLPTGVFVRIDLGDSTRADFAPAGGTPLRLDQIGALYTLVHQAERRQLRPVEVTERLDALLAGEPRFAWPWRVTGLVALTVGLGLVIDPSAKALPAYVVLALVVAVVDLVAERVRSLRVALPVAASFVVSYVSYQVAGPWFDADPRTVLVPPLVTYLPGAALTIGTVELATGSIISGAGRLMSGLVRLLLLAFGITAGAAAAGQYELPSATATHLGWWAPWVGVAVFGVGHFVYSPAPRKSLGWLLLILFAAYGAQVAGAAAWGAVASGFTGALVVPPLARWVENRREGPPGLVTFLPAFWLLVPGALGVAGVAEIVGASGTVGIDDFVDTIVTVVAVALGVLVGTTLTFTPRRFGSRAA
jgi:uncharacterized membrane protein YjjB (DUF3815 family)